MSEDKASTTKRATKKAVVGAEAAKPAKVAAAPKSKTADAGVKTGVVATPAKAAGKAAAPKRVAKVEVETAVAPAKAKKTTKAATAKPAGETKKRAPAVKKLVDKPAAPSVEERQRWVATAAYHRAEKRGFAPGYEVQDWLDAEAEINELVGKA